MMAFAHRMTVGQACFDHLLARNKILDMLDQTVTSDECSLKDQWKTHHHGTLPDR